MTVGVFIGFGYLLLNDISYNLTEKPFTFDVKDKFMSAKDASAMDINLGQNNQSFNFLIGLESLILRERNESFDPFDNDYIDFTVVEWDSKVDAALSDQYLVGT